MPIYDGGRSTEDIVNRLVEAAQRTIGPVVGPGVSGIQTPTTNVTQLARETNNQSFIRESFLGTLVDKGPNAQDDYTDSRYWVRQVYDASIETVDPLELNRRPLFKLTHNDPEASALYGNRWVSAVNLAEYNHEEPEAESHGLAVGDFTDVGPIIVQVFFTMNKARDATWYFWSGGSGSTLAFALVYSVYTGSTPFIAVRLVVRNTETNVWEFNGEPVDVWCWPPLDSRYYEALVWTADTITPDCNPIGIRQVGGQFYAEQTLLTMPIRSPGVSYSDCRTFA